MKVVKTKFGYFPCNKSTYRRIKKLRAYYFLALQQAANWQRWQAKMPANRVIKSRGDISSKNEPKLVPVFSNKEVIVSYFDHHGKYLTEGRQIEKIAVCDMGILMLYEAARKPKKYEKTCRMSPPQRKKFSKC